MSDEDDLEPVVFTASLMCADCDALFEAQSAATDHGLCPICGGSLLEIAGSWSTGEPQPDTTRGTHIIVVSPPAGEEPPLVVRACRHRSPDVWTYALDPLAVKAHGFSDAEVMSKLVAAARVSVRDVLTETRASQPRRHLAMRLSLADTQGRLEEVLTDALVLDDERTERLQRDYEEESRDRA